MPAVAAISVAIILVPCHVLSSLCNSFEDRAPVDFIYGCPIFKWVAVTWLIYGTRAVIRLLTVRLSVFYSQDVLYADTYSTANKLCIWVPTRDRIWSHWRPIDSLDINVCRKKNSFFQDKIPFLVITCSPCWVVLKECLPLFTSMSICQCPAHDSHHDSFFTSGYFITRSITVNTDMFYIRWMWASQEETKLYSHQSEATNHWQLECLFDCYFRQTIKKTSSLCVIGFC